MGMEYVQQLLNELISKRQQGFDKLFWEIYEQAYDQNIRRLKKEQDQKEQ